MGQLLSLGNIAQAYHEGLEKAHGDETLVAKNKEFFERSYALATMDVYFCDEETAKKWAGSKLSFKPPEFVFDSEHCFHHLIEWQQWIDSLPVQPSPAQPTTLFGRLLAWLGK